MPLLSFNFRILSLLSSLCLSIWARFSSLFKGACDPRPVSVPTEPASTSSSGKLDQSALASLVVPELFRGLVERVGGSAGPEGVQEGTGVEKAAAADLLTPLSEPLAEAPDRFPASQESSSSQASIPTVPSRILSFSCAKLLISFLLPEAGRVLSGDGVKEDLTPLVPVLPGKPLRTGFLAGAVSKDDQSLVSSLMSMRSLPRCVGPDVDAPAPPFAHCAISASSGRGELLLESSSDLELSALVDWLVRRGGR